MIRDNADMRMRVYKSVISSKLHEVACIEHRFFEKIDMHKNTSETKNQKHNLFEVIHDTLFLEKHFYKKTKIGAFFRITTYLRWQTIYNNNGPCFGGSGFL